MSQAKLLLSTINNQTINNFFNIKYNFIIN